MWCSPLSINHPFLNPCVSLKRPRENRHRTARTHSALPNPCIAQRAIIIWRYSRSQSHNRHVIQRVTAPAISGIRPIIDGSKERGRKSQAGRRALRVDVDVECPDVGREDAAGRGLVVAAQVGKCYAWCLKKF